MRTSDHVRKCKKSKMTLQLRQKPRLMQYLKYDNHLFFLCCDEATLNQSPESIHLAFIFFSIEILQYKLKQPGFQK